GLAAGQRFFPRSDVLVQLAQLRFGLAVLRGQILELAVDIGNGGFGLFERAGRIAARGLLGVDLLLQRLYAPAQGLLLGACLSLALLQCCTGFARLLAGGAGHACREQQQGQSDTSQGDSSMGQGVLRASQALALPCAATAAMAAWISAGSPR